MNRVPGNKGQAVSQLAAVENWEKKRLEEPSWGLNKAQWTSGTVPVKEPEFD